MFLKLNLQCFVYHVKSLILITQKRPSQIVLFVSGADSYNIYVYQVIDDNLELHASESVLSPPYTVQLLNPGTEYRTRIRAVGLQDQESADSVSAVTATST